METLKGNMLINIIPIAPYIFISSSGDISFSIRYKYTDHSHDISSTQHNYLKRSTQLSQVLNVIISSVQHNYLTRSK